MTDTEVHNHHCPACSATERPPEIDIYPAVVRDLLKEGFLALDPVTSEPFPIDYPRIKAEILRRTTKTTKTKKPRPSADPTKRSKVRDDLLTELAKYNPDRTPAPLFLPYDLVEDILYVSGGEKIEEMRNAACGGTRGFFVYYAHAYTVFHERWAVLRSKTKARGRPPTHPLLGPDEWPWKTPPTPIDRSDVMGEFWDPAKIGVPTSIRMFPRFPVDTEAPKFDGTHSGVLRSHVKAILDTLAMPGEQEAFDRMDKANKGWATERWAARVITEKCLQQPYAPHHGSLDETLPDENNLTP